MARVGTSSPLTLLKGRLYRQLIRHRLRLLSGLENSAALFDCPERTILYPISKHAPSLRRANNACGSSGSLLRLAGPWSLALFLLFFFRRAMEAAFLPIVKQSTSASRVIPFPPASNRKSNTAFRRSSCSRDPWSLALHTWRK